MHDGLQPEVMTVFKQIICLSGQSIPWQYSVRAITAEKLRDLEGFDNPLMQTISGELVKPQLFYLKEYYFGIKHSRKEVVLAKT